MALVEIQNVSKTFKTRVAGAQGEVHALSGVSFSLDRGEIVAITGASGCGKTTMLRIIMGLEQASGGAVVVNGKTVNACGYDRGMVFQHSELLPWRNALDNVAFGLELKGMDKPTRMAEAARYLDLVLGSAVDAFDVMSRGRVAEMLDVRLPRPRPSLAALRGDPEFGDKRLRLWELLKTEMDADARKAA